MKSGRAAIGALTVIAVAGLCLARLPGVTSAEGEALCTATTSYLAKSPTVIQGSDLELELAVAMTCVEWDMPTHLVFVMDASSGISSFVRDEMQSFARDIVDNFDLDQHPALKFGVVAFDSEARTLCELTNEKVSVDVCLKRAGLSGGGGTRVDLAIDQGLKELLLARRDLVDRDHVKEILILISHGGNATGCPPVLQASGKAQGQGVLVSTVCVGSCDESCLRQAASNPRYFFSLTDEHADMLASIVAQALRPALQIRTAVITDTLAAGVSYVQGSAGPDPTVTGSSLVWNLNPRALTQAGVTSTFRVRVDAPVGRRGLSDGGFGRVTLLHPVIAGEAISFTLPTPVVDIRILPRTLTPTRPPTAVPTTPPTNEPVPIYLPAL